MVAVAFAEGGDDAYYVFTVARNIASGHGITIDQVNWTSGFQPLWAFLCSLSYLVGGDDRGAFAIIYAASVALWLGSVLLLLRIVREATGKKVSPTAAAVIAVLFLCETHLNNSYLSGLETGLHLTLCLALLLAFQFRLDKPAATWQQAAGLGALCGAAMLARNDAVFLCAALIGMTLLASDWKQALKEAVVTVSVASVMVLPWLGYCYWLSGDPMPQSGIATSIAVRGFGASLSTVVHALVVSVVPTLIVKTKTLIDGFWPVMGSLASLSAVALFAFRRSWMPATTRGFRLALTGLAAGSAMLVAYYVAASFAGHFFDRYFTPIKLIVVVILSLAITRAFDGDRPRFVMRTVFLTLAVGAITSNVYWVWRDFNLPFRGFMGKQAYEFVRSPYAREGLRLGLGESGRLGFLYPDRVVNLDGKMRVDALRALRDRKIADFLRLNNFDYLLLRPFDAQFFDELSPGWRKDYQPAGSFDFFDVFSRVAH